MNKTNNGDDFELLYEAYTGADEEEKDKNEELEDEENPVEEESHCDEDEDDEDDTVEEGVFDRVGARVGAAKDAAKTWGSGLKKAAMGQAGEGESASKQYSTSKANRILQSHYNKINTALSSLVSDAVKMGLMEDQEAEKLASDVSNRAKDILNSAMQGGKKIDKTQKRDFKVKGPQKQSGDAAARFQQ